jgi:hypothetical protein
MKYLIFVAILFWFVSSQRDCGTPNRPGLLDLLHLRLADSSMQRFATPFKNAIVEVYFHIIINSQKEGLVTTKTVLEQMDVLNKAYKVTNIQFELVQLDITINDRWYGLNLTSYDAHYEMKNALRKGGPEALNIYTTKLSSLGYSTFPADVEGNKVFDGVVVELTSLPGGSYVNYNLGMTVVHEVGHWCGLQHTFKGNDCEGEGDSVDDTPAQMSPTTGCPSDKVPDSCSNHPGLDMIHNYMDYSVDSCIDTFTPGQIELMTASMRMYRGIIDSDRVLNTTFYESRPVIAPNLISNINSSAAPTTFGGAGIFAFVLFIQTLLVVQLAWVG